MSMARAGGNTDNNAIYELRDTMKDLNESTKRSNCAIFFNSCDCDFDYCFNSIRDILIYGENI